LFCRSARTKYSQPNLDARNRSAYRRHDRRRYFIEEDERLTLEALKACRQNLSAEGINLSAYDSLENAADINALRDALGYEKSISMVYHTELC